MARISLPPVDRVEPVDLEPRLTSPEMFRYGKTQYLSLNLSSAKWLAASPVQWMGVKSIRKGPCSLAT